MSSSQSQSLKGQRVHACSECGKVLTRNEHLQRHIREVHLGERRSDRTGEERVPSQPQLVYQSTTNQPGYGNLNASGSGVAGPYLPTAWAGSGPNYTAAGYAATTGQQQLSNPYATSGSSSHPATAAPYHPYQQNPGNTFQYQAYPNYTNAMPNPSVPAQVSPEVESDTSDDEVDDDDDEQYPHGNAGTQSSNQSKKGKEKGKEKQKGPR